MRGCNARERSSDLHLSCGAEVLVCKRAGGSGRGGGWHYPLPHHRMVASPPAPPLVKSRHTTPPLMRAGRPTPLVKLSWHVIAVSAWLGRAGEAADPGCHTMQSYALPAAWWCSTWWCGTSYRTHALFMQERGDSRQAPQSKRQYCFAGSASPIHIHSSTPDTLVAHKHPAPTARRTVFSFGLKPQRNSPFRPPEAWGCRVY